MNFSMNTPAILFSAISLFMLAFTNRFLALSNLIRSQIAAYISENDDNLLSQIKNLLHRLQILKYSQIFSVLSFLLCVISMFVIFIGNSNSAEILFAISLVTLFISLLLSLYEILLSFGALKLEISKISKKK